MPLRLMLVLAAALLAGRVAGGGLPAQAYDQLRWRLLGPFRAGWALCAAGSPCSTVTEARRSERWRRRPANRA